MIPPVERIIGETGLSEVDGKVQLDIRLPWYRSLPLSTVEIAAVEIDGNAIPLDKIQIQLSDEAFSLEEAKERRDRFWYVLDSAFLVLPDMGLERGTQHDVTCTLCIYPPYIAGLKRANTMTQTLIVR